jgi:hypothetical protein
VGGIHKQSCGDLEFFFFFFFLCIGCSRSARLCNSKARARARHEPKFSVRDRLAKEELLIELELELDHFGRSRARVLGSSSTRVKKNPSTNK